MEKRTLILNDYDTAEHSWTLASCVLTKGSQVQTFVSVPGRYAPVDLSTYLTDGQPYYDSATLEATLECSAGTREDRTALIAELVNLLDGKSIQIVHPDHPTHYLVGRVQIFPQYNDLAHAAVLIQAVCEPWLYAATETVIRVTASASAQIVQLINYGRMSVVPTVTTTGEVTLVYGAFTQTLSAGTYDLPDLLLTTGAQAVTYKGTGVITFTYREAVLAA